MKDKPARHFTLKKALAVLLAILLVLFGAFFIYASIYYTADEAALQMIASAKVPIVETNRYIACGDSRAASVGYIFYPGAKVEAAAYVPYLLDVAQGGPFFCVVVKPAFHLAILSPNRADDVRAAFPDVDRWLVGGHSLGGVVAASYALNHQDTIGGLVLLASYPNNDLSAVPFPALTITGANDGVLNWERFAAAAPKLPSNTRGISIEGGNHGQFGSYGPQRGDGEALLLPEEQRRITADATIEFLAAA